MSKKIDNPFRTLMFSKEFYEYYALEILKKYDYKRYEELAHIGGNEFPDLQTQSLSIGVEVTCAFKEELLRLNFYCAEYLGAPLQDIPTKVTKELLKGGRYFGKNNGRADICYCLKDDEITDEEQIQIGIDAIRTKTLKLNTAHSFSPCLNYELFIFLHKYLARDAVEKIYTAIDSIYEDAQKQFSKVYILSKNYLYVCEKHFFFPYDVGEFLHSCRSCAYIESGMEEKSRTLLKQQGHI